MTVFHGGRVHRIRQKDGDGKQTLRGESKGVLPNDSCRQKLELGWVWTGLSASSTSSQPGKLVTQIVLSCLQILI